MEISYLKEFVVLAQTGSFLEAAETLYSSQSSLSKHIKTLEAELGVPLFERTTRKVKISKFGEMLLPFAQQIVEAHENYLAQLHSSLDIDRETLSIGSIPALAQYNITDVLVNFKKSRPQSTINVVQASSAELKAMLRQKSCELAFIRYTDDSDDDIVEVPYTEDTLAALLPANHPLAGRQSIPLQMLAHESFLLIQKDSMLYWLCVNACKKVGFEPNVVYTDHRLENLTELIIQGMGVALLMQPLARYIANPQVVLVELTPVFSSRISLCYLKGLRLSEPAKHFIRCADNQRTKLRLAKEKKIAEFADDPDYQ